MKYGVPQRAVTRCASLPVRGAWIEIRTPPAVITDSLTSLPVRGAWIEMKFVAQHEKTVAGRSPCGERGLKLAGEQQSFQHRFVAPRAGSVD